MPTEPAPFRLAGFGRPVGSASNGKGGHRSGWPYVVSALQASQSAQGLLVEDFVERTFDPNRRSLTLRERLFPTSQTPPTWTEPWVGVFHYPPNLPEWLAPSSHPSHVLAAKRFETSRPYLRGAIALSEYLAEWLETRLAVPVTAIKHPTEIPDRGFSWDAFMANPDKQLVQVGWYLRNYRAIYQVDVPADFTKVHLMQDKPFVLEAHQRTDQCSPYRDRPEFGEVSVVSWLSKERYDELFTANVIFLELFDASANNAIIEAIVRETPIVVNRHPAVEEYLGVDYPLLYDDLNEVKSLLSMPTLRAAHEHLANLDKSDLSIDHFMGTFDQFLRAVQ